MSDDYSEMGKHVGFKIDPWLGISGSKYKDHLAALGMISIDWNACETIFRELVSHYLDLPDKYSPIIMRQLGNVATVEVLLDCSKIKETDQHFLKAISHLCKVFDRCRENRNDIMHSLAIFNLRTLRMEKPPYRTQKMEKVFHFDLKDLRRVADDIKNLQACMARLMFALDERDHPERNQPDNIDHFLQIVKLPLPDKLIPLPSDAPPVA